jgi:hypothetical protein
MALTNEVKERITNRILFLLSKHPANGQTLLQLQKKLGEVLNKDQLAGLLNSSRHAHTTGYAKDRPANNPAHVWNLKKYVPGSPEDEDLKRRIELGSELTRQH